MRELRHENGVPAKKWVITLSPEERVDGAIKVALGSDKEANVVASYSFKKDKIVLHFSRVADGKATLNVIKGARPFWRGLKVSLEE